MQKRLVQNVPRTLDNTREFDPSILTANPNIEVSETSIQADPSSSTSALESDQQPQDESAADLAADPFAAYFSGDVDTSVPPKVLITTSARATRVTYGFCEELVTIFPGAEFIRRKKGRGFEMGKIAGWAAERGYSHLMVVNEDMKKPSRCPCSADCLLLLMTILDAITMVYLPEGPTAYFKLTSIALTQQISVCVGILSLSSRDV